MGAAQISLQASKQKRHYYCKSFYSEIWPLLLKRILAKILHQFL